MPCRGERRDRREHSRDKHEKLEPLHRTTRAAERTIVLLRRLLATVSPHGGTAILPSVQNDAAAGLHWTMRQGTLPRMPQIFFRFANIFSRFASIPRRFA